MISKLLQRVSYLQGSRL